MIRQLIKKETGRADNLNIPISLKRTMEMVYRESYIKQILFIKFINSKSENLKWSSGRRITCIFFLSEGFIQQQSTNMKSQFAGIVRFSQAAMKLGQDNIFTSVCLSIGGRGVCLSACWDIPNPPWRRQPPGPGTPLEQTPPDHTPRKQTPPHGADTPPGSSHPPRPDTPPGSSHPPRPDTPPGSSHPPRPDTPPGSRLQHTVNERPVCILLECILVIKQECIPIGCVVTALYRTGDPLRTETPPQTESPL